MMLVIITDDNSQFPVMRNIEEAKDASWDDPRMVFTAGAIIGTLYRIDSGESPLSIDSVAELKSPPV